MKYQGMLETKRNPILLVSIGLIAYLSASSCAYLLKLSFRDIFVAFNLNPLFTISFIEIIYLLTITVGVLLVLNSIEERTYSDRKIFTVSLITLGVAQLLQFLEPFIVESLMGSLYHSNYEQFYEVQNNTLLTTILSMSQILFYPIIGAVIYKKVVRHY